MKLTDRHVGERRLMELIEWYSLLPGSEEHELGLLDALLELKQRRAEDRQCESKCEE